MTKIKLTQGKFVIIDKEDAADVLQHTWFANKRKDGVFYACRCSLIKPYTRYLHRELLQAEKWHRVIFINRITLDCRRQNLRMEIIKTKLPKEARTFGGLEIVYGE